MRSIALLTVLLFTAGVPFTVDAASVCQKGKKVKLRPGDCKGKETSVTIGGGTTDLSGIWKRRDGTALTDSNRLVPTFLTFNPDGTGRLNRRQESTHALRCLTMRYALGAGTPTATIDPQGSDSTQVVQVSRTGDALTLSDEAGTSNFDRVGAVDADADCPTLTETSRLTNIPVPESSSWSNLPYDGTIFVYRSANTVVAINATTGLAATAPTLNASGQYPNAFEAGDMWGNCACGSVNTLIRSAAGTGTQLDAINTNDFGASTIQGVAVPQPGLIYIYARAQSPATNNRLLLINSAMEPDTLVSSISSDLTINTLAYDGAKLWGFQSGTQNVVRIEPSTGLVSGTFLIPDAEVSWKSMSAAPGQLFLVGVARDNTGVLAKLTIPAP